MDYIGATPQQNPLMGLLAERLKQAQEFAIRPFGYQNPPAEMLLNLLGIPAVQQTAERLAYGEPLTTGRGMTTRPRPEAVEAALTVAPMAGLLGKATKGLPVGASIKSVDDFAELASKKYPQEEALRLAQQRAALPVSEGGLGLRPDNTAAERAAAMGFDKNVFHGAQNEIDNIDFAKAGKNTGNPNATLGFFTTPNPEEGSRYATLHGNNTNANVIPLVAKSENSYQMPYKELDDLAMAQYNLMMQSPDYNPNAVVKFGDMKAQKEAAEKLQKYRKLAAENSLQRKNELMQEGFDSATVLQGKPMEEFIVFNPDIIRSRFAAFDPFRRNAAIAAAMGVAAPNLLAEEKPKKKKKNLLD
jgi:hypothetical protein